MFTDIFLIVLGVLFVGSLGGMIVMVSAKKIASPVPTDMYIK